MRAKVLWQIGAVIVILAIIAGAWLLFISPKLAEVRLADSQREQVDAQNAALQASVASLAKVDVAALSAEVDDFQAGVPATPGVTGLFRQIRTLVESNGAILSSVELTDPSPFTPSGTGSSGDPEKDAAVTDPPSGATDAKGNPAAPGILLPVLKTDIDAAQAAGLLTIGVTIQVSGQPSQILAAARALQLVGAQRQITISSVSIQTGPDGATGSLVGTTWVLPLTPVDPGKPGQGPAGAAAPTPTATPAG